MSHIHLNRYVNEFVDRHNIRPMNTIDKMEILAEGMRANIYPTRIG